MISSTYVLIIILGLIFFFLGRKKIINISLAEDKRAHSLVIYHGYYPFILAVVPPLVLMALWVSLDDTVFNQMLESRFPIDLELEGKQTILILLTKIQNIADGVVVGQPEIWIIDLANKLKSWRVYSEISISILTFISSITVGLFALSSIGLEFRARNAVEKLLMFGLIICSLIAIITTIGIIFSVIFESIRFFKLIPPLEFLTGTVWNPEFEGAARAGSGQEGMSQYGSIPLFVGTFLISIIALSVAVPVGLFSAIYLSEYASKRLRGVVTVSYTHLTLPTKA